MSHKVIFVLTWATTILLFQSCNFGSVGNKEKENIAILENLQRIVRETQYSFQPILHSYDDQEDRDLSRFTLTSSHPESATSLENYQVEILTEGSFIDIEKLEFRINPPQAIVGLEIPRPFSGARTHTPYTIPLDLPSDDPYGKTYTTSNLRWDFFMNANSEGIGYGPLAKSQWRSVQLPQGIVASVTVTLKRWDLQTRMTRISDGEIRNAIISIQNIRIPIYPRCRIEVKNDHSGQWMLGINYARLFRDYFRNNQRVSLLGNIFSSTNRTEKIQITDLNSLYGNFLYNLQSEDTVIIQESCLQ